MKLYTKTLAAALCAGGFGLAMGAQAQPGPGGEQQGMHGFHHRGGHHGGLRALDLTEAQRDQIFKIRHEQAPAFREQMKKVRASREELRKLASADKLDQAAVRRAADAQAKALSDMAVLRVQAASQVRAVLTPEQKAKLDQMHERRHRS